MESNIKFRATHSGYRYKNVTAIITSESDFINFGKNCGFATPEEKIKEIYHHIVVDKEQIRKGYVSLPNSSKNPIVSFSFDNVNDIPCVITQDCNTIITEDGREITNGLTVQKTASENRFNKIFNEVHHIDFIDTIATAEHTSKLHAFTNKLKKEILDDFEKNLKQESAVHCGNALEPKIHIYYNKFFDRLCGNGWMYGNDIRITGNTEQEFNQQINKFFSNMKEKDLNNQLKKTVMSTKNYVGNSYKTVTEKGTFYNFEVRKETIEKMEGADKRNEIFLAIEPKNKVESERHPTHSVYAGDRHEQRELQLVLSKDVLLKAPVDGYGNIKVFAASREKIGADLSNYSVALEQKDPETGKYQFIGRGYDGEAKFGETRVVGVAFKTEFGLNGENGKVYNVNLDANKVSKLTVNEYGDTILGIVPYTEKVPGQGDNLTEETRYLVTETNGKNKGVEATIAIHLTNPKGKEYPTLDSCAIHKIGNNEVYKFVVQDKKPENIGKDCADLTVAENKYTPEMKDLPEADRKAALADKNYVGRGWTNDPSKIRLDIKNDLSPKGLTAAIDNNHTVKVIAILERQPTLVRASHLKQIDERQKDANLKTSAALIEKVRQTFDNLESKKKKNNGPKLK